MKLSDIKVLLVYPNYNLSNMLLPAGVSILSAVMKQHGIQVKLFDSTLYPPKGKSFDDVREELNQLKKSNQSTLVTYKKTDMLTDFTTILDEFNPHLVACSALADTWDIVKGCIEIAHKKNYLTLLGGVWPTFAPEEVLNEECIDIICRGEGERFIVELCKKLANGEKYEDLKNLGYKRKSGAKKLNELGPLVSVNELPYSDYSIFEKDRFYRPMQGKTLRIIPIEMQRGCPYLCAFCEDPSLNVIYKDQGRYHRAKSPERIVNEILHFKETYGADYIYFNAETFFAMPGKDFNKLVELYSEKVKLPFWIQTRPETITEDRIKKLKQMGVANINIGLEHGNEKFRAEVLKRRMSNDRIIKGLRILNENKIPATVNNIMGFPDETRELIFDTIELNRNIKTATINAFLYTPFKGTDLYDVCKEKGYLPKEGDEQVEDITLSEGFAYFKSILNMPQITKFELMGLQKTFTLYCKLPKSEWHRIRIAEKFDEEGKKMFDTLSKEMRELERNKASQNHKINSPELVANG